MGYTISNTTIIQKIRMLFKTIPFYSCNIIETITIEFNIIFLNPGIRKSRYI